MTTYVTWNPDKIDGYMPKGCKLDNHSVEALIVAEEESNGSLSTCIEGNDALHAAELIVCNEFDGNLCSVPLHEYHDAEKATVSKGLFIALIQTAQRTTDLEGVYCTSGRRFYSWEQVKEEMNANDI